MHREPAMPVTESVSSFDGFSDVYPSSEHELARLFDKCEFDKEGTHHHTISFKEAIKRLRTAVDNSLSAVEIITKRKVSEFRIGKTSVMLKEGKTFDPMKPTTWGKVGGANGKWRKHKDDNYDNLIAVGCVTNELIPQVIKETNTAIRADDQLYALEMVQALVQHYMVQEPDGRLRNKSFDIKNFGEGKIGDKGGIICVAYKLEPEIILKVDSLAIKKEEQEVRTATIESLKKKLEEEGLHFRGSIPDDGNSFFKACSDQLQRLEFHGHTHTELRQMVIPNLQFYTENEIKSANFTRDTWKIYIDKVAEDNENVEDIVVEAMAKLIRRQIIIYSRSLNPTKEISTTIINEDANGPSLLLAKDKLYYQSLERRHGTPSRLQEEALPSYDETVRLADLEEKLISYFANGDSWREGKKKTSFNYLLLDPRVTNNLPSRMDSLGKVESFKVFVAAIFYVGKGQRARPFKHLYEAISKMEKTKTKVSEKVKYIQDIWSDNVGVVSLHCFQNAIAVEAYTREACMIDAISVHKLTNMRKGTYYGISERWSEKEKRDMGFYFLRRALKIFKEEGERPLLPGDLKGGQ